MPEGYQQSLANSRILGFLCPQVRYFEKWVEESEEETAGELVIGKD
jgi:hypothetical protein